MTGKHDVQNQFGSHANAYVKSEVHAKGKDLQKLVEMANVDGNEQMLDVATGGGHTANAFAPLVRNVTAFDITQKMLLAAEKFIKGNGHINVDFVEGDAENIPFAAETFNLVTCRIAPHHFPDVERFATEVHRVLKNNGQFLLDDNIAPEADEFDQFYNTIEKRRDYSHHRALKKTEWLRMLELQGFEITEMHRFTKHSNSTVGVIAFNCRQRKKLS
ncbi:MAG TPA: class I SAM-dependent methyltransferase [Bacillales bacterium]|nr:class I SAM-dependent methyltransferase [Bacillales bacterium]